MNRTVHRHYEFSTDDIKEALIDWLRAKDIQYPTGDEISLSYKLTENGAELSWAQSF